MESTALIERDETKTALETLLPFVDRAHLSLPEGITIEQWASIGNALDHSVSAEQWWLGDWLTFGETHFGEAHWQYARGINYSYASLQNLRWVAMRLPPERRRHELSWSHHQLVAKLDPDEQELWLDRAVSEGLSKRDLKDALSAATRLTYEPQSAEPSQLVAPSIEPSQQYGDSEPEDEESMVAEATPVGEGETLDEMLANLKLFGRVAPQLAAKADRVRKKLGKPRARLKGLAEFGRDLDALAGVANLIAIGIRKWERNEH